MQGEEIGMTEVYISWEDTVDPQACRTNPKVYLDHSRDRGRTPFQWDDTKNSGFSEAKKTWLPMARNYTHNNVELQNSDKVSHLKVFRTLMELRQNPTLKYGDFHMNAPDNEMLVYKRELHGQTHSDIFVMVLNMGNATKTVDLVHYLGELPQEMKVEIASIHSKSPVAG